MAELDIIKLASICLRHLEGGGFAVSATTDFAGIEARMPAMGKTLVSPSLRAAMNDFSEAGAFWLTMSRGGEPVAEMGMRLDDLGRDGVDALWARAFGRHYRSEAGTPCAP